jgi:hypothetical protein
MLPIISQAMKPAIFLWSLGALIVILYYSKVEAINYIFDTSISDLKKRLGQIAYPFLMSAIMSGIIPVFVESAMFRQRIDPRDLLLVTFLYGFTGVTCNLMYVCFDLWFGNGIEVGTIIVKLFIDQFIYMAFWSGPIFAWGLRFKGVKYSWNLWWTWDSFHIVFPRKWLTQMISGWMIWIPLEIIIYVLPLPLQFPVMNLFCILFALILLLSNKAAADQPSLNKTVDTKNVMKEH